MITPPCYNRPPPADGTWDRAGYRRGKIVLRWRPRWFDDVCRTWDGTGIGANGEPYPEAHGWHCSGCRLDPRPRPPEFPRAVAFANWVRSTWIDPVESPYDDLVSRMTDEYKSARIEEEFPSLMLRRPEAFDHKIYEIKGADNTVPPFKIEDLHLYQSGSCMATPSEGCTLSFKNNELIEAMTPDGQVIDPKYINRLKSYPLPKNSMANYFFATGAADPFDHDEDERRWAVMDFGKILYHPEAEPDET